MHIRVGLLIAFASTLSVVSYAIAADQTSVLAGEKTIQSDTTQEVTYTSGEMHFSLQVPSGMIVTPSDDGLTLLYTGLLQGSDVELTEGFSIHVSNKLYEDGEVFDTIVDKEVKDAMLLGTLMTAPTQITSPISKHAYEYKASTMAPYTVELHDLGASYVTIVYESYGLFGSRYDSMMHDILNTIHVTSSTSA